MKKNIYINSGQYYAEKNILSKINSMLVKIKGVPLTNSMVNYQIDTITINPNISSRDINLLIDSSDLKGLCDIYINERSLVSLIIKRPKAWPIGLIGIYILFQVYFLYIYKEYVFGIFIEYLNNRDILFL